VDEDLEREVEKDGCIEKSQDRLVQAEAGGAGSADRRCGANTEPSPPSGGFARRLYKSAASEKRKNARRVIVSEVDRLEQILKTC
jgi:hypothetical protein